MITIWRASVAVMLLAILLPGQAVAATYFDENFETTLTGNGWSTDSCVFMGYTAPMPASGCNPFITSEIAHAGSKSLRADYTGNPPSRSGCPNSPTIECGVTAYRTYTPTVDHWKRFWHRTAAFTYSPITSKKVYDYATDNTPSFVWEHLFGSRELSFVGQGLPSQTCPSGSTGSTCNFTPNMASVPLNDNQWYCIETHLNLGSAGGSDGVVEIFINGTQTVGYYGKRFLEVGQPDAINQVKIYAQSGSGVMYYDDFAIGNTRIGCGAVIDNTPPGVPTGLRITELWEGFKALVSSLWDWLGPEEALAVTAVSDQVVIRWEPRPGQRFTLDLTGFGWTGAKTFADLDAGLGTLTVPLPGLPPGQPGDDRWLCATERDGKAVKGCNQLALGPIVLPPVPAPPATVSMLGDTITIQCDKSRFTRMKTTGTGTKRVITCLN